MMRKRAFAGGYWHGGCWKGGFGRLREKVSGVGYNLPSVSAVYIVVARRKKRSAHGREARWA